MSEGIDNDEKNSVSELVCNLKMCNLKDILVNHENKLELHDTKFVQTDFRLKTLEDYNIQAKISNEVLQKQMAEQKALTLELNNQQRATTEKEFAKVDAQFAKNTLSNDKQFEKNELNTERKFQQQSELNKAQFDAQNVLLLKLIEGQNIKDTNKTELTKGKIVLYGIIFSGFITFCGIVAPIIINHFWK